MTTALAYGDTIELASDQMPGLLMPDRQRFNLPHGRYIVTQIPGHPQPGAETILHNIETGQAYSVAQTDVIAVTAEVAPNHRSYRPLAK